MSEQKVNSVFPKIMELRKKVTYLQRNADGYNYKYVNGSNVLGVVKPLMNDLDLEIFPSASNTRHMHVHYTKPKEVWVKENGQSVKQIIEDVVSEHVVLADLTYTWVDAETGDQYSHTLFGAGSDPDPSKAQGKMLTYMERYHLLKTLNIATDNDDPDAYMQKYQGIKEKSDLIDVLTDMREGDDILEEAISAMESKIKKPIKDWTLEKLVGLKGYLEKLKKETADDPNAYGTKEDLRKEGLV